MKTHNSLCPPPLIHKADHPLPNLPILTPNPLLSSISFGAIRHLAEEPGGLDVDSAASIEASGDVLVVARLVAVGAVVDSDCKSQKALA
jgi:hypothetical protein